VALSYLLDTSAVIGPPVEHREGRWALSVVTLGELEAGVLLAADPSRGAERLRRLAALREEALVLDVDRRVAARYGELRAVTGRAPSNDLWIAATALAHERTLVTRDRAMAGLPLVASVLV